MKLLHHFRGFLCLIVSLVLAAPVSAMASSKQRPNLLIIQTDEHNFRTLGCYRALLPEEQAFIWGPGVAVETPNIDWIAKNGAIAERFYATSPVCTPSRAALVTGRYPQNTGAISNGMPLRDDMITFAEVLRKTGYSTGYAGKWHLDGEGKPAWAPRSFGFVDNRYMFNRGHWKKLEKTTDGPRVSATNSKGTSNYDLADADEKTFTTDFLADRTIEFIKDNKAKPFCYMVSFPDPHGPNLVRAPYDTMFTNLKFQQPKTAQSQGEKLPAYAATLRERINNHQMAQYFGMVKCIDDNIGRILNELRVAKLLGNTIIVFTSDHGDLCGEHGRINKGPPMEASARVPFLIYAPGKIKPGTVVRELLGMVDFKPTVLSLMKVKNPTRDEGRDASQLFTNGKTPRDWKDISFLRIGFPDSETSNAWMGAFTRHHKFVVSPNSEPALFDLEKDPEELKNVFTATEERETVRRLGKDLMQYARTYRDPMLESAAVRADLEWAVTGKSDYHAPVRNIVVPGKKAKRTSNDED
ncbi:MAG: sulfatase-like hydrolase/transferase [Verrucomicrobia bacterium]|nr:sulfatase-like hydrolase/transferase [Verrucomicrobiota bacterium]